MLQKFFIKYNFLIKLINIIKSLLFLKKNKKKILVFLKNFNSSDENLYVEIIKLRNFILNSF